MKSRLLPLFIFLSILFLPFCIDGQIITTIVGHNPGTGAPATAGYSGDGGLATAITTQMNEPAYTAIDNAGNLYIADYLNNVVRKVTPAGIISTFAGNGTVGYLGDGGPATAAQLWQPSGLAFDAVGNLYIADYGYGFIRKVNTSGIISTVAGISSSLTPDGDGGPASAANIPGPGGLAIDASGNMYIAEAFANSVVRKINTAGIISTIAGNGIFGYSGDGGPGSAASLYWPAGLATDASGNLYICDANNYRVRKVNSSGIISTFAGTGSAGGTGDGGPATAAKLRQPWGVVVDNANNVFFSEYDNHTIRKVNASGIISLYAGDYSNGYIGDGGPATGAELYNPQGICFDAAKNLYIADFHNNVVRVISSGNHMPVFTGGSSQSITICLNTITSVNTLLAIVDSDLSQTETWTVATGPAHGTLTGFPYSVPSSGGLVTPVGLSYNPASGYTGNDSFKIQVSDGISVVYTTIHVSINPYAYPISGPSIVYTGLTISLSDPTSGGVWTSSNTAIATVGTSTGIVTGVSAGTVTITYTVTGSCGSSFTTKTVTVASGSPSSNIYTFAGHTPGLPGYSGDGGPATSALLNNPTSVAITTSGNVHFTDYGNHAARCVLTSGNIITIAGNGIAGYSGDSGPATAAQLHNPNGIATDASGNFYIGDFGNNRIRKVSSGIITTICGNGISGYTGDNGPATNARLNGPKGLTVTSSGNVHFADNGNHAVRCILPTGNVITIAGTGTSGYTGDGGPATSATLNHPNSVATDAAGNIYIADLGNNVIRKIDPSHNISTFAGNGLSGYGGDLGAATAASLSHPSGVCVDNLGNVYIADEGNNKTRKVDPSGIISTLSGTGASGYSGDGGPATAAHETSPSGLAVSSTGIIYIADKGNNVLRIIGPVLPITGTLTVCTGLSTTLSDATPGGTWSISNPAVATINAATGLLTGVSAGTATVTYTTGANYATAVVSVGGSGVPTITSVSPAIAIPGTTVNITGTNFNPVPTGNIVYFGATKATVLSASSTTLSVTVPYGATYFPASVDNIACGLTAYMDTPSAFLPTFDSTPYSPGTLNFESQYFGGGDSSIGIATGDLDGDGFSDVVVYNYGNLVLSAYRNTSTIGGIISFASMIPIATTGGSVPWAHPFNLKLEDIDGDGKLDMIVPNPGSNTISVFRNTSSLGTISFASKIDFTTGTGPFYVSIGDIDHDGKPDIIISNSSASSISVLKNLSTSGIMSFAPKIDFTTSVQPEELAIADIDRDGWLDIVVGSVGAHTVNVFRNLGISGTISSGSFATPVILSGPTLTTAYDCGYLTVGDIDGDKKPEIILSNNGNFSVWIFGNLSSPGSISFPSTPSYTYTSSIVYPQDVTLGDFDGNGKADIAFCNNGTVSVLRNFSTPGNYSFVKCDFFAGTPIGITADDMNNDGLTDILTSFWFSNGFESFDILRNKPIVSLAIIGPLSVCQGFTVALHDSTPGGFWTSSNPSVGSIDFLGNVTGIAPGTTTITYSLDGSCNIASVIVTVNPVAPITGPGLVCVGSTITLGNAVPGGNWSSTTPTVATIGSLSGVVHGLSIGYSTISYTSPGGCISAANVFSGPPPPPVVATGNTVCVGMTITVTDASSASTWSSSNTAVATVGSLTGIVTGVTTGTANISYTNACGSAFVTVTVIATTGGAPAISSVTPRVGYPLAPVSISGFNFNADPTKDIVYFGATKATVVSASATNISVLAPLGDTYYPVSVNAGCMLTGFSNFPFLPDYNNAAYVPGSISFDPHVDFNSGNFPQGNVIIDIDGDHKPDIVSVNTSSNNISVFLNNSTAGTITGSSLATAISFTTSINPQTIITGDLDGDGKPDLIINSGTDTISILLNRSTPGLLAFATRIDFVPGGYTEGIALGDIDADGRLDIVTTYYDSVAVFLNNSAGGIFLIAPKVTLPTKSLEYLTSIAVGDLNNDGRPDIAVTGAAYDSIYIFRNTTVFTSSATFASGIGLQTKSSPGEIHIAYVDNDLYPDLIIANEATDSISVYHHTPGPGITFDSRFDFVTEGDPIHIDLGDFDGDGKVDMAVTNSPTFLGLDSLVSVYRNTSSGSIISYTRCDFPALVTPRNISVGDIDLDGKPDIVYSGGNSFVSILRNDPLVPITGGAVNLCLGNTSTFIDSTAGGTWSSSNPAVATVGSSSGIVTGISSGTAVISYSLHCSAATKSVTVISNPAVITPSVVSTLCPTATLVLSDATPGGIWSSSNPGTASVGSSSGVVTGILSGSATITYSAGSGCFAIKNVTVNQVPSAITGISAVCVGSTSGYSNSVSGGVWTSSNIALATIGSATGIVTGLSAGTLTISYTLPCGVVTKTITINPIPALITGLSITCTGTTNTLTDITPGGVWTSGTAGVATIGPTNGIVTGISSGFADIVYTLPTGCFTSKFINVANSPTGITGESIVCAGSMTNLSCTPPGGVWNSSNVALATVNTTGQVTGVSAGTLSISYTLSTGCKAGKNITVNPLPASITGSVNVCTGSSISLTDVSPGGIWSGSNNLVATIGSSSGIVSGVASGNIVVSYTLPTGCAVAGTITVNATPVAGPITGSGSVCQGATLSLTDAATGGSWSASNSAATVSAGLVTAIHAGLDTIAYTVVSAFCTGIATKVVTVNPLPVAGVISGADSSVCPGITLVYTDTSGGGTGVWSATNSHAAVSAGVITGGSSGIDTIAYTVTTACGSAVAQKTLTVNSLANPGAIVGTSSLCQGSSVTLTDTITTGTWSSGNPLIVTVSGGLINGLSAGVSSVSYSVTNICGTRSATMQITVNPLPSAGILSSPDSICVNDTVSLSETVSGGTWSVYNASASLSGVILTGLSSGRDTISYTVSNAFCSASVSRTVTVNPLPNPGIISGPGIVCESAFIMVADTITGGVWQMSNGTASFASDSVTGILHGLDTISYTVSTAFCHSTTTKTITVNPLPHAGIITGSDTLCVGQTVLYSDTVSGGTWGSTAAASISGGSLTGLVAGRDTVTYTVINGCGTDVASKKVIVMTTSFPGVIIGSAGSFLCPGGKVILSDSVSGGIWSSTGPVTVVSGTVSAVSLGVATISYSVANRCGTSVATTNLTINPAPAISGSDSVCVGQNLILTDSVAGGIWSDGNLAIGTINSFSGVFTGLSQGSVTVNYSIDSGCSVVRIITVNPLPSPGIITGLDTMCVGAKVKLQNTAGGGFWSSQSLATAFVDSTGLVYALATGSDQIVYMVRSSQGGCISSDTFTIHVIKSANFILDNAIVSPLCYGSENGSISVSYSGGKGPFHFAWSNGDSVNQISNLKAGSYMVNVSDLATNCSIADTIHVIQPDSIQIEPTIKNDVCNLGQGKVTLVVSGGTLPYKYLWNNNDTTSQLLNVKSASYSIKITDNNKCNASMNVLVGDDKCINLVVHDVITPNGDGFNDVWVIEGIFEYPKNEVYVFDKWGDIVFQKTGYANDWGGKASNGELVPDGTYFYVLKLNEPNHTAGGEEIFKGSMLIKR